MIFPLGKKNLFLPHLTHDHCENHLRPMVLHVEPDNPQLFKELILYILNQALVQADYHITIVSSEKDLLDEIRSQTPLENTSILNDPICLEYFRTNRGDGSRICSFIIDGSRMVDIRELRGSYQAGQVYLRKVSSGTLGPCLIIQSDQGLKYLEEDTLSSEAGVTSERVCGFTPSLLSDPYGFSIAYPSGLGLTGSKNHILIDQDLESLLNFEVEAPIKFRIDPHQTNHLEIHCSSRVVVRSIISSRGDLNLKDFLSRRRKFLPYSSLYLPQSFVPRADLLEPPFSEIPTLVELNRCAPQMRLGRQTLQIFRRREEELIGLRASVNGFTYEILRTSGSDGWVLSPHLRNSLEEEFFRRDGDRSS